MALSLLGIGLAVMMAALGVLTIIEVNSSGVGDFSEPFLAAYMVMFAALLFMYELMWWTPMPSVNKAMRKNFGFLYGLRGKGLYLIFVACLCLGLGKDATVKELVRRMGIVLQTMLSPVCLTLFCVSTRTGPLGLPFWRWAACIGLSFAFVRNLQDNMLLLRQDLLRASQRRIRTQMLSNQVIDLVVAPYSLHQICKIVSACEQSLYCLSLKKASSSGLL